MKADQALGIATILAGGLTVLATSNIQIFQSGSTLSARSFPYLLSASLIITGMVLTIFPRPKPLGEISAQIFTPSALLVAATFLIYALSFRHMDFRVGTWLFVLIMMLILGARKPKELIIAPLAVSIITFYIFRHGFTVLLPTWN